MDKACNCNVSELVQYDGLSTNELRELLRLDIDASFWQNLEINTIVYIAGLFTEQEKNNPGYIIKNTEETYETFQKNYTFALALPLDIFFTSSNVRFSIFFAILLCQLYLLLF